MNYGPFIFLGSFLALLISWATLVLTPQLQLKDLKPVKDDTTGLFKPAQPAGEALQGAEVYRANGCNYCHSQQVQQKGYVFDVVLEKAGDFPEVFARSLMKINPKWQDFEADMYAMDEGGVLFSNVDLHRKTYLEKQFDAEKVGDLGVKIRYDFKPTGPDIARGWGPRGSVAADYMFADPAMIGDQRIGPDLANLGGRWPGEAWQMNHLYAPRSVNPDSTMPAYEYLFETRKVGDSPSPEALQLTGAFAPPEGYEIVPTRNAELLVAYLKSLQIKAALAEAPMPTQ